MFVRLKNNLIVGATIFLIAAGCASSKVYVEKKVELLYNNTVNSLEVRDYLMATQEFEEVERQHPYSVWAVKTKLMAAYSHYQANKYDEAVIGLDRYIRLHPAIRMRRMHIIFGRFHSMSVSQMFLATKKLRNRH